MQSPRLTNDQLSDLMVKVLEVLPGAWTWRPNPSDWAPGGHFHDESRCCSVKGTKICVELYVHNAQKKPGSLRISAVAPRDSRNQVPYEVSKELPSITVSATKTPDQIARDVERRLLPEWIPLFEQAVAAIEKSNAYESTSEEVVAELAEIAQVSVSDRDVRNHRVSFYHSPHQVFEGQSSEAEVHGSDVTLTLRLSHDDAVAVLKYLCSRS